MINISNICISKYDIYLYITRLIWYIYIHTCLEMIYIYTRIFRYHIYIYMRCMYIYIHMYDDIFRHICDIYIYIHDTHAMSWILQIGFPPKNTQSWGKSEPFVPVLYNPCGRSVNTNPGFFSVDEDKSGSLVGSLSHYFTRVSKSSKRWFFGLGISEPSTVSSTVGWKWLVFFSMYFWIFSQVVQLLSFHRCWVSKIFSFAPRKTNMSPENQWLEDVFPIEIVHFSRTC